jgi:hypothetical protein
VKGSDYLHDATINTSERNGSVALTAVKIRLGSVHVNGRRVGSDGPRTWEVANVMEVDLCGGWEMSTCDYGVVGMLYGT